MGKHDFVRENNWKANNYSFVLLGCVIVYLGYGSIFEKLVSTFSPSYSIYSWFRLCMQPAKFDSLEAN